MRKFSFLLAAALALAGCSHNPGKNPDPVEISGTLTQKGKPVSDVTLNLQATGRGTQAAFPVKNGTFKGSATPGKYTYFVSEGARPAALNAIPAKYHSGSLDRQIEVGSGSTLTLALD